MGRRRKPHVWPVVTTEQMLAMYPVLTGDCPDCRDPGCAYWAERKACSGPNAVTTCPTWGPDPDREACLARAKGASK